MVSGEEAVCPPFLPKGLVGCGCHLPLPCVASSGVNSARQEQGHSPHPLGVPASKAAGIPCMSCASCVRSKVGLRREG